ncbi:suppressor of RPS4-RLD 1-like [Telopea speciosissima]|uniref:suppressor of RPS4-RLD 1-like n=1 Tax=Telopea speciosissima TaxID=54955 RepID=UPI001CC4AA41|nr:suppressor of RPS4-RLD 1-like [Telopea speciosissima]
MGSTISERVELAKLCSSRDWSKAIRILDSLLSQSCAIQDFCNRAFCYSQLELHKHVIKDCDKALQLDPKLLQAYILKGRALSALGRKDEALLIWEQGYECAVHQSAELNQLLELEELLACAKKNKTNVSEDQALKDSGPTLSVSDSGCETRKSSDTSEIDSTIYISEIDSKSSDACEIDGKSSDASETHSKSSAKSETHSKSSDASEIHSESREISEIHSKLGDESKRYHKLFTTGISKNKSFSLDLRLARGIAQVNEGKFAYAVSIFDQILKENPTYPEALIGRGTAYAFQGELDAAIADFTKAIEFECNPSTGEAWKRRGQARAALGEPAEAIEDFTKALEFEPNSSDTLHQRGMLNFKLKDYNAAVEDLSSCVKLDKDNKSAFTDLGLALASIGEYRRAEEAHLKSIQLDQNFLEGWANLVQFYQDLANPVKALECLQQVLQIDVRFTKAYHLRGLLRHGMGEHRNAIKDLSVGLSIESSNIECLYLRASCYHAIGEYRNAVKDYDALLSLDQESMEKFVLQCLAYYQKEIALYTASKINMEFCWFDIDGDIDPLFKEYWCKGLHPQYVSDKVFRQPPLRKSLKKNRHTKQDFVVTKQKATLLQAADSLGERIQYDCPGFLPNRRQHRMAGLAAIEIAQKVSKAWRSLQAERKHSSKRGSKIGKTVRRKEKAYVLSQNRGGAGCSTSSSSETSASYSISDDKGSSHSMMSWKDLYSLAVKWRQISEPCDPVVWVNKLSENYSTGFGSHTPMVLGQARVVRYFPNYRRTLSVAKTVIMESMFVNNKTDDVIYLSKDGRLQKIMHAQSCSDLYDVVGEDFWLATWCESTAFEGKRLEGTRITLQKMGEHGFEFGIRTPCAPSRWNDYDAEMAMAWEAISSAYCGETYGSTDFDMLENVRDAILRMTYYWYNFMPLSRGSASVGFVVLLGLFLAANMEFTESIPQGLQVDWEVILTSDPNSFVDSIKHWLYPSLKIKTSWKEYPDVQSTFTTTGSAIAALSSYDD